MTTNVTSFDIDGAAAAIGIEADELRAAIAEAVDVEERGTANMCTVPGPALAVEVELAGRRIRAQRDEADDAHAWRFYL